MLNYLCYQYSDLEEYNDVPNSNNTKVITTPPSAYTINRQTLDICDTLDLHPNNIPNNNKSNVAYNTFSNNDSISSQSSSDDSWENISDDDLTR
jgi:hypothetical protein